MSKLKIIIIAVLSLIIVVQIGFFVRKNLSKPGRVEINESGNKLEAQTNSEGPVSVKVTPLDLSQDKWKFEVFLNTHSVELDYDLTKLSILSDSSGNQFMPLSWEGDPPGGHHRSGVLIFNPLSPKLNKITLEINQIGEVEKRSFSWDTK